MDTENCQRCLPRHVPAMGFIPLPEPSRVGDSRFDEQRILVCNDHYFEAKKNCFYVVPFDRDDDPVDNFIGRINRKHKEIRGSLHLKYGSRKDKQKAEREETQERLSKELSDEDKIGSTSVERILPPRKSQTNKNHVYKVHYLDGDKTSCGLPAIDVVSTTDMLRLTCKNCANVLASQAAEALNEDEYAENTAVRR